MNAEEYTPPEGLAKTKEEFIGKLKTTINYCGQCHFYDTAICPYKDDPSPPTKDSVACGHYEKHVAKGSKPKCGNCAAFHTPFCSWEYKEYDGETMQALAVDAEAYACTRFYPKLTTTRTRTRHVSFEEKVENL